MVGENQKYSSLFYKISLLLQLLFSIVLLVQYYIIHKYNTINLYHYMSTFYLKKWFTHISHERVACICHAVSVLNWAWHLLKGSLFAVALVNTRLVCDGESNPCQSHLLHLPREIPRPSVNTSPHSSSVVCPQSTLSFIKGAVWTHEGI